MIRINLLPTHILETRRVKALLRWIIVGLVVVTGVAAGYIWGPAPFCLGPRRRVADDRLAAATQASNQVAQIQSEAEAIKSSYGEMAQWVAWVEEADRIPGRWIAWFNLLRKYIPADVVVTAFPSPSTNLSLTGYTSDLKAATRWYLNMLRCEMIDGGPEAVRFSTQTTGWPEQEPGGDNPKMRQSVSISIAIRPDYLTMLEQPPMPASAGVSGGRGGGAGRGRMGAGRGGGTAGRGGRGGRRGGGPMGGG